MPAERGLAKGGAKELWDPPNEYVRPSPADAIAPCKARTVRDVLGPAFSPIVCLCGSTRFWKAFQEAGLRETLAGRIVLSVGCATASDEDHGITADQKARLDDLHLRKIDLADEVLVLNVGGYVGESTGNELAYALALKKPVRTLEPMDLEAWRAERSRKSNATAMRNLEK
jgi:hypothetical protein